jgi:hypothetical protein
MERPLPSNGPGQPRRSGASGPGMARSASASGRASLRLRNTLTDACAPTWCEVPRVRRAVAPVNFERFEPLLGIAFLPRPFHPREVERHTPKAPQGAFLLRDRCCESADPSECWKGGGGRGCIGGGTGAAVHANLPTPYLVRPRARLCSPFCALHNKVLRHGARFKLNTV